MYTSNQVTLTALAIAGLWLFTGCTTTADGTAESPLERAVDQPLEDAAGAVEDDYRRADEQHEDIIDKAFAPLDDTVDAINRDLNKEPGDSADPSSGNGE
ncbi:MAG: hypothetical protein PVJ15_05950 [Gammaproteobacteria bacterium]|jgi:hypothetical protein